MPDPPVMLGAKDRADLVMLTPGIELLYRLREQCLADDLLWELPEDMLPWATGLYGVPVHHLPALAGPRLAHRIAGAEVVRDQHRDMDQTADDTPEIVGELAALRRYKRENFGLMCRNGHHTRRADVIGDPNDADWRCSHCVRIDLDAATHDPVPDDVLEPDRGDGRPRGVTLTGAAHLDGPPDFDC